MKKKKVAHSLASYQDKDGPTCDLMELAQILSNVGQVPERINFTKACEIKLLATYALIRLKREQNEFL